MRRLLFLILFLLFTLFVPARVVRAEANDRVSGQILVKFNKVFDIPGTKVTRKIDKLDVFVLKVPEAVQEKVLAILSRHPNVEFAEPDYYAEALLTPNDPDYPKQWAYPMIRSPQAWDITTFLGGTTVAVLDTGIDQNHEDLSSKVIENKDFTSSASGFEDMYGHGTHVSGIVAANTNNGIGVAGGCPGCQLLNGKVLNDSGSGVYSWIANGIIWAADNKAKVINLSLGGSSPSRTLESAVNYAWKKGAVIVAAAGNSGNSAKLYPAAYTNVIAVAATNSLDQKAYFSSYGARWVDVAAPGENIFSTFPNHPYKIGKSLGYDYGSGTSMASPMVAAEAGLIWSTLYGTSNSAVRARLEQTADKIPGTGTYWSAGRIDVFRAVQ